MRLVDPKKSTGDAHNKNAYSSQKPSQLTCRLAQIKAKIRSELNVMEETVSHPRTGMEAGTYGKDDGSH